MNDLDAPPRTLVYEEKDVVRTSGFPITPDGHGMRVDGPGTIDNVLLIGSVDEFGVRVETEDTSIISEDFETLERWSNELAHVSAYETETGDRVVNVEDFPYQSSAYAEVEVFGEVRFDWIRAVYTLDGDAEY